MPRRNSRLRSGSNWNGGLHSEKLLLAAKALPGVHTARPQYWYDMAIGRAGFHLSATANVADSIIGVRVYLSKRSGGEAALNQHLESRAEIEKEVGEPLHWNPNPEFSDKVIVLRRKADIRIKDQWPEHLKWMVDAGMPLVKSSVRGSRPFIEANGRTGDSNWSVPVVQTRVLAAAVTNG